LGQTAILLQPFEYQFRAMGILSTMLLCPKEYYPNDGLSYDFPIVAWAGDISVEAFPWSNTLAITVPSPNRGG
jgi:hypothetical protein